MLLGKTVLQICSKFTEEQSCFATLLKSHFSMGIFLSYIFSEHLFLEILLTIEVRFMKKLRNTEAEFKKALFKKEKASSYRKCLYNTGNEISFCHEKKFIYISFYCGRKGILFFFFFFFLIFRSTIFAFMKYQHAQMFSFG